MVYWLAQYKEQEEAPPNCGARVSMEYNKPIAALEVGDEIEGCYVLKTDRKSVV